MTTKTYTLTITQDELGVIHAVRDHGAFSQLEMLGLLSMEQAAMTGAIYHQAIPTKDVAEVSPGSPDAAPR